jgi:hypothetical protein
MDVIRRPLLPAKSYLPENSTRERIQLRQVSQGGSIVNEKGNDGNRMSRAEEFVAMVVFSALLSVPALAVFGGVVRGNCKGIVDPDVWWHLRTAEWILANEAWPTTDPFSHTSAGTEWTAYSWLFELLLLDSYRAFGLRGIVLFTAALWTLTTAAFFSVVRKSQAGVLLSGTLTLIAILGTARLATPRPWHLTMLCVVVELGLLLTASRTSRPRLLLWLVPLFCFWANVHIQFVLGLAILAAALLESCVAPLLPERIVADESRAMTPWWMLLVLLLCMAATLINPYGWRLYEVVILYVGQADLAETIQEFGAMGFRLPSDWVVLGVTISVAFAIGRGQRIRLLLPLVFLMATYFSFRCTRDMWFVLLMGLVTLAYVRPANEYPPKGAALPKIAICGIGAILAVLLVTMAVQLDERALEDKVAAHFPKDAVAVVREQGYEGPMFNTFNWGGFLIYHLPEHPVSIDGRTNVHGTERCVQNADTFYGKLTWEEDPELAEAGFAIIPREIPLASLMRHDQRFKLAYEDDVVVVFVADDRDGQVPAP